MSNVLPFPVRATLDVCTSPECGLPIQPGQLYAVLADGPRHFGCSKSSPKGAATPASPNVASLHPSSSGEVGRGVAPSSARSAFPPLAERAESSGPDAA